MIYLKSFDIPKDSWVDFYFNRPPAMFCEEIRIRENIPDNISQVTPMTDCDISYPWNVFYGKGRSHFEFGDITIFYGGNGSGKSTLLNVITQKLNLFRNNRYNKSNGFDDYVEICQHNELNRNEVSTVQRGKIIASEDVFDIILKKRKSNEDRENIRDKLIDKYYDPKELPWENLTDPEILKQYKDILNIRKKSCSSYVRSLLESAKQELSNGETAFNYFVETIKENSLVLLDEPENSLSAKWQVELSYFLLGTVLENNCQLIISTHSPFLLSLRGARVYDLDTMPIMEKKWNELENVQCYYDLFKRYEYLFSE